MSAVSRFQRKDGTHPTAESDLLGEREIPGDLQATTDLNGGGR